ncbi:3-oxoacyl-ACP reductase FabG [candidate division KSB1 bacterium]|nr:3-oxoacyl-ACP reductase FabG [candidate division KSB1 bacterium]RQW05447.1 MAG: 3-oxoacyl-ACP reductase FabG [candidate division KSB1 bacterium]
MDIRFNGKVVLITGGSSGIGAATAIEFARSGASVVVNYNATPSGAAAVVAEIQSLGGNALAIQADVTDAAQVDRLVRQSLDHFGRIDILFNNAGTLVERKLLADTSEELFRKIVDVNFTSTFLCCQAVVPHMKMRGYGRIINMASVAARNGGGRGAGHYAATKAAVLTLTKAFAKELAGSGIQVNAVAPGVIATRYHERFSTTELREQFKSAIPLAREGKPEEIAYVVLFLASEFADYILGETIEINGGMLME